MINDIRVSPHFRLKEFQCRCCGLVKLSPELLAMLEKMRGAWGGPLIITSGYRCPAHNREAGGAVRSLHLRGMAVDISAAPEDQPGLYEIAKDTGFSEVICAEKKQYVHLGYKTTANA